MQWRVRLTGPVTSDISMRKNQNVLASLRVFTVNGSVDMQVIL